ncbi:MAG: C40 family peptidase [Zoogloeaceae bacterium]|jgi:cell wall-associated NlpC family hydrolase|nr:C40 family peptidase [Zoogloeaceae bacterium]
MRKFVLACCCCGLAFSAVAEEAPTPLPAPHVSAATPAARALFVRPAQAVLLKALELVGVRYHFGGESQSEGFDCSGYVQAVFSDAVGLDLPRTAAAQAQHGVKVGRESLKPGDLVFFHTGRKAFSHVGIYLGDHYFLHAPRAGSEIRVENMQQAYWQKRFNGARRLLTASETGI